MRLRSSGASRNVVAGLPHQFARTPSCVTMDVFNLASDGHDHVVIDLVSLIQRSSSPAALQAGFVIGGLLPVVQWLPQFEMFGLAELPIVAQVAILLLPQDLMLYW